MENNKLSLATLNKLSADTVGHDVLRYVAFPELVGGERDPLLYFIGKNMARRFDLQSLEDVVFFFHKMKWGKLDIVKEKKNEFRFHLMADEVAMRIQSDIEIDYRMEAGFIASALEVITERPCECFDEINEKLLRAEFRAVFID